MSDNTKQFINEKNSQHTQVNTEARSLKSLQRYRLTHIWQHLCIYFYSVKYYEHLKYIIIVQL